MNGTESIGVPATRPSAPLASVVVPARDAAAYVGDALSSLACQFDDPADIEVIVVDDGSRDATAEIARTFRGRLPRLEVIGPEEPEGVSAARNRGVERARGRYIAFLDADDWLAPGQLSVLARSIGRLGCDFVRTDVVRVAGFDRSVIRVPWARRDAVLDPRDFILPVDANSMVDHPFSAAGIFDRRLADEGLLRFAPDLFTAEDRLFIWRLFLGAGSFAVVDGPGLFYRRDVDGTLSRVFDERRLGYLRAFERVRRLVEADAEAARLTPKVAQTVLALTAHHLRHAGEMAPPVREALVGGACELLASFPPPVLRERVEALDRERAGLLAPVFAGLEAGGEEDPS